MTMDALLERVSAPAVVASLALFLFYALYTSITSKSEVPSDLPWIGKDSSKLFAETRASFSSFGNVRKWLGEGYEKYSKKGKSYVFPDFSGKPEVIIPRTSMQWLLEQPDNVLSVSALHYDLLEGDYGFTDPHLLKDPYHEHVVHRSLARRMGPLVMDIWDEMQCALDETWGVDTENWKDICVFENMMIVIARASNRLFLGLPLCRNQEYLTNMGKFAMDIVLSMTLLRFVPRILKPIVGHIITLPNHYHYRKTAKYTVPLIKERLANMERKRSDPAFDWSEPNDYITWHISIATAENNLRELTPNMISRRLMPLNFAAIHTTVFTITNTFFDLIASDPSKGYLEGIREEAARIYAECGGTWTKAALAKMIRTDSAIRESMRVSNFMTRGVMRKVISPEGISNKAEGWSAPQNAYIGLDVHSVQHDPEIYSHPEEYDAFRFSRPWEELDSKAGITKDSADILKLKNTGLITTSDTFLPFGHGRHACPGRFFVSHELKLMIAYMVLNYDIEPLPVRPPNQWFGQNVVPPMKNTIRVRRKAAA